MKYADFRTRVKTGDMLLWSSGPNGDLQHDIEVEVVKHATHSDWSHVGIALVQYGRVEVMDLTTHACSHRLLSEDVPQGWIPCPRPLSKKALEYAFSRFGKMKYSRWQAILGFFGWLDIGEDMEGECAEFVLEVYREDGIAPTTTATPAACANGALRGWEDASLFWITLDGWQTI